MWPVQAAVLAYFLIMKPSGKDRPLALLPTMLRWWEALRCDLLKGWRLKNWQEWDATESGRGSEYPAWEVMLYQDALDAVQPAEGTEAYIAM
eukprot:10544194-Lingulodinium_polyedra.AAC.1